MREFHWCDFEWDPRTLPRPGGHAAPGSRHAGLRICVWINPYIAQRSALFDEGRRSGYLLRRPDGDVWQWDLWQAGHGAGRLHQPGGARLVRRQAATRCSTMGVDCFKTDFGERIPTDVVWPTAPTRERMHNYYTYLYNQTVFELLRKRRGEGEAVLFARSATAGGQQFPVHWGGDCDVDLRVDGRDRCAAACRSACPGFGFWSHDIGGFEGTPDAAVFKRWIAFGLLSSHSRLHGSGSYRVPWLFDEEAVDVAAARSPGSRLRLMPYLLGAAGQAAARRASR